MTSHRKSIVGLFFLLGITGLGPLAWAQPSAPAQVRPNRAVRYLANVHLRSLSRSLDKTRAHIEVWDSRGQPNVDNTGRSGNLLLVKVAKSIGVVGKRLANPKAEKAYRKASPAARQTFTKNLDSLREDMTKLDGLPFVGGEINPLFDAPISKPYRAGLKGFNHFLVQNKLGYLPTSVRWEGGGTLQWLGMKRDVSRYLLHLSNSGPSSLENK